MELNLNFAEAPHLVAALTDAPAPRRAPLTAEKEIAVLVANPKRPGSASYDRFELYSQHNTVAAFLAAGGRRADLAWDAARGFISLAPRN